MNTRTFSLLGSSLLVAMALCLVSPAIAGAQMRSFNRLVSSNGHLVISYDREASRIDTVLEHPFRFLEPREEREDLCYPANESRDLAFDTYFGVRIDGAGTWLGEVPVDSAEYEEGTNIIQVIQRVGDIEITSRFTTPTGLDMPVVLASATAINTGDADHEVTLFGLINNRLGDAHGERDPSAEGEEMSFGDDRGALYEYGPSQGTFAYLPLDGFEKLSTTTGGGSAYENVRRGQDLDDSRGTSGPTSDVSAGMQSETKTLATGVSMVFGFAEIWALDEDAGPKVDAFKAWSNAGSDAAFQKVRDDWAAWHTEPPASLNETETKLWYQSNVFLRMGQVREAGGGFGQILASLPPGLGNIEAQWNISWVRDMAYAVAGLILAGHMEEAAAALRFQLEAPRGEHTLEVGRPYRISITRYFGNGREESDCNADGPNIEFDGFGLFLWTLGMYLDNGGDPGLLGDEWWNVARDEIADVLVSLVDPSGVIAADSSIWEVHWNGRQRRFTYTSLAAVRGLCDAATIARSMGDDAKATEYETTATGIRDAVLSRHVDGRFALGQSAEDIIAGTGYLDAATVEAMNWGIVAPDSIYAKSTLRALLDNLTVETGVGLMRNDDGGWYDSQEWVFVDFRTLPTLAAAGFGERAGELKQWLEAQALANDLQFSELHAADSGNYEGSIPMVGFGAGAYIVALAGDAGQSQPACGAYPPEPEQMMPGSDAGTPDVGTDGGMDDGGTGGMDAGVDGGGTSDGGTTRPDMDSDRNCSCSAPGRGAAPAGVLLFGLGLLGLAAGRRKF